jgi:hypothetical protein
MEDLMNPTPAAACGARPRPLLRTILSLAVAAVIAASIPFAAIYAGTLQRPPVVAALSPGSAAGQHVKLVTTASGRQVMVPASGASAGTNSTAGGLPVVTRTSGRGSDT